MTTTPPPLEPPKKGLSGLAIFGIGCGVLFLLVFVAGGLLLMKGCSMVKDYVAEAQKNPAKAAATLMLRANPDVEVLKTDDAKSEITFKDKKTGEVLTISFEDAAKGKFLVKNEKGEKVTVDATDVAGKGFSIKGPKGQLVVGGTQAAAEVPAWVPAYPGVKTQTGGMHSQKGDVVTGVFTALTADAVGKVKDFFYSQLKFAGFTTEINTFAVNGSESATVSGKKDDQHKVTVMINPQEGQTRITLQYEGPKN
jgi:hypothetical protein